MKKIRLGFTLVELLIVIAIIAILAVVGLTIFSNTQKNARDGKRKADVEAISQAFEVKYSGGIYPALGAGAFAGGVIPAPPGGGYNSYNTLKGSGDSSFRVCASLEGNSTACTSPASLCYCKSSGQALYTGSQDPGGGSQGGPGLDHPSSCDTTGTLGMGLVGYWKMDEPSWSGTAGEVKDYSGANNNGVAVNGATTIAMPHTGTFPAELPAVFSNSGNFDGVNDYLTVNNNPSLNLQQLTVSAWVRPLGIIDSTTQRTIIGKPGVFILMISYGQTRFTVYSVSGTGCNVSYCEAMSGSILLPSNWYFLVGTFDGSKIKVYVNGGPPKSTRNWNFPIDQNTSSVYIGANVWGNAYGQLDDVRIYNRSLSDNEINALFNGGSGCLPS